ncbi:MAG: right-handed parallel beta-helix repeat-containing protein [bacterium]
MDYHVSRAGNDGWTGTIAAPVAGGTDGPFATIERARDAIRALKAKRSLPPGGVTVWLHGGIYPLTRGVTFSAEDSGTVECPIVYRAAEGDTVRLVGGVRLDPAAFTPVTDPAVRARLDAAVRDRVVQVDLRAQGVTDFGAFASRGFDRKTVASHLELFFNDRPMTVAQWPDAGEFLTIAGFTKAITSEWGHVRGDLTGGFTYEGDRPQRWASSDNIWAHGYWAEDWANSYERVSRIDPIARLVETAAPHGNYSFAKGQRFYFLNVLEELDQPGEYYVDADLGMLYFLPPSFAEEASEGKPASLAGADILVSILPEPLLALKDVSHLEFRGLTLEAGRGNGVEVAGGDEVRISGCVIRNFGNWGIQISGGMHHAVRDCDLYGMGDGGIGISGGDRQTLTPCHHSVVNCHIHHYARWSRCYVAGIGAGGVGLRLANNLIHDAPHNAILFGGNDILIENNEIHRVCLETGDAGAIYTGRDYTYRGNVIRRNFIHHMGGMGMGSMGIYMDDCVSGTQISENILWHCQQGIHLGGGRDFRVDNNVMVDCKIAIHADARGLDPNPVWQKMVNGYMRGLLEKMRYHEPPYSVRYPEIAGVDPHYAVGKGVPPEHNSVSHNICWRCEEWISDVWTKHLSNGITETGNLVDRDPGFLEGTENPWRLRPDSPALALGFCQIPMEEIGLVRGRNGDRPPHNTGSGGMTHLERNR